PLPLDPAERPAAPEPDSGVVGDVEPTPISENPVSESSKFLDSLLEEATGQKKAELEGAISELRNKSNPPGELAKALKVMSIPQDMPDELIQKMLLDAGQDPITVGEVMELKSEWETKEEDLEGEPELDPEDVATLGTAKERGKEMLDEMKKDTELAKAIESREVVTEEDVAQLNAIEEKHRGRIKSWFDENPGKIHKVNRLLVRPGIAAILILSLIYLSLLSAVTSGAAKRVAK
ncbi:MAG TPA: hypothetical protein VNA13_05355, partial [Xanthomonadales bacterium]|nr:hypothetical protein [Xanthomonadales bacterium]